MNSSLETVKNRIVELLSRHEDPVGQKMLREQLQLTGEQFSAGLRDLLEQNRVVVARSSSGLVVSLSSKGLSDNFAMVLREVQRSGTSGVDQAALGAKLRIPKTEIAKALHSLVAQRYIQECRSFTNRAKKMYLLYNLKPSVLVTGGAFYCGEELDVNFVDNIRCLLVSFVYQQEPASLKAIQHFIQSITSDAVSSPSSGGEVKQEPLAMDFPATSIRGLRSYCSSPVSVVSSSSLTGFASIQQQQEQVVLAAATSLTSKQLARQDIAILTRSLVLDGVLDECLDSIAGGPVYRIAKGKNVMRHFSTVAKRKSAVGPQKQPDLMDLEEFSKRPRPEGDSGMGEEERAFVRRLKMQRREESLMVPSPLSHPSAGDENNSWSYMSAVGFPCLGCPQLSSCCPGGVINPIDCIYLRDWRSEKEAAGGLQRPGTKT